ncbi:MAG: methyltransferase domain-containing protein [Verrucomicrobiota bacterium]
MFHPKGPSFMEQARQALSSTKKGYDLLAPKFEFTPYLTPSWMLDAVAPLVGEVESGLDVCCGTGAGLRMLAPSVSKRLVGIDFSQGMLNEVEVDPGEATLELVQGDVRKMEFSEEFDVATCFGALGHFVDDEEDLLISQVFKVLKPGGRFLFVTGFRPERWTSAYWFTHSFNTAMRVRNALIKPQFVMYFHTFILPGIRQKLEKAGFEVAVRNPQNWRNWRVVCATRPSD